MPDQILVFPTHLLPYLPSLCGIRLAPRGMRAAAIYRPKFTETPANCTTLRSNSLTDHMPLSQTHRYEGNAGARILRYPEGRITAVTTNLANVLWALTGPFPAPYPTRPLCPV